MSKQPIAGTGLVAEQGDHEAFRTFGDGDGSLMPLAEDFERLFKDLVEGSLQGIMVTQGEKLVFANHALAEMLGYTVEDLIAMRSWEQLVAPGERKRVAAYCRARADNLEAPDRYEYEALRKDGSSIWLENLSRTVTWNGKPATQATVVDITKRRRAEDALRESEARYRTLAEFASEAVFIHDGIEIVETNKAAERMYGYTRDEMIGMPINVLVAPESRGMVAEFIARQSEAVYEGGALGDVIRHAVESNAGLSDEMDVTFALDTVPDPVPVMVDAEKISQVLANFLSNAAKFSTTGGEVRITVGRNGAAARVSVLDDGPGVPEPFRDHIFEKFSQADTTDARDVPGSGLGLYICKAIIEQHGGSIGFENRSAGGSTFHFDLPLHEE